MGLVRTTSHPSDAGTADEHPPYGGHIRHTHVLHEDWPHEKKQLIGAHIDRWHFPATHEAEGEA
jgi:hypothetical protein